MTNEESAALMADMTFRGRIKVSGLKFATTILNENPAQIEGHSARYRWAQTMAQNPDVEANRIQPMVVMDPAVQDKGSSIDDAQLQSAVEAVVNKFL